MEHFQKYTPNVWTYERKQEYNVLEIQMSMLSGQMFIDKDIGERDRRLLVNTVWDYYSNKNKLELLLRF